MAPDGTWAVGDRNDVKKNNEKAWLFCRELKLRLPTEALTWVMIDGKGYERDKPNVRVEVAAQLQNIEVCILLISRPCTLILF